MTSETDSTSRRRPPTIDLTAEEIETENRASAQESAAPDAEKKRATASIGPDRRGDHGLAAKVKPYAVGAVAGAIVGGAIIVGIWIGGFAPAHETAVGPGPQVIKTTGADEISSRLDKIQEALQAPRPNEALAPRVAAAEAQTKALGNQVDALDHRLDDLTAASQTAAARAKTAAISAERANSAAQAGVQRNDIDALSARIAALENSVKSLSAEMAHRASATDDRAARMTVAAEALRATVERGAPYEAELAAVKSFGVEGNEVAPLMRFAPEGLPSTAALARELAALMPALQQTITTAPSGGSFLGRLEAHAQNLVRITPTDAPAAPTGNDPYSLIARINGAAARGDISAALSYISRLPETSRSVAADWVGKAEAREAAIAASRHIAAGALAALRGPTTQ
jgi:hypothetical protein